jgi:hypothetical protein
MNIPGCEALNSCDSISDDAVTLLKLMSRDAGKEKEERGEEGKKREKKVRS